MTGCLPEATYALYVDGELESERVRDVESHLIRCQECRVRILALEEEAQLLADVLLQRMPAASAPVPARQRARGLAVGLVPSLAVSLLVVTVGGWLLEQRLPGLSWWSPATFMGAYEMAFDAIFLVRDTIPAFFDLALAVGATVALASVLTFLMSALLRHLGSTAAALLLSAGIVGWVAAPPSAQAMDLRWDQESVEVAEGDTLEDTLVASAETIDIDGTVIGDVIALAERITIRGRVEGNVFAFSKSVLVTGVVDGSLHMGCDRCALEGGVERNLYGAAEDLLVAPSGRVGRDVYLFGDTVRMEGSSGRDLAAAGERVEIRGEVGRTVRTRSERLSVLDSARIGGDLMIEIRDEDDLEISPAATISGETTQQQVNDFHERQTNRWLDGGFYVRSLVFVASAFLVGLLLHAVFPQLFGGTLVTAGEFGRCLGWGFVALVATPLVLVLLAVSVVGIPIAVLGIFLYLTLLFVSTIVVAALVGSAVTGNDPEAAHGFGMALLLGLVVVVVLMNLPFVGGLLRVLVGLAGMGLVITTAADLWQERRREFA